MKIPASDADTNQNDAFFRLLCVDDDLTQQQALMKELENYGFEVVTASHGFDAMMQFRTRQGRFRAIVVSHAIRSNGAEFAGFVREMGYKGRIIVLTGRLTVAELRSYEPHSISGYFSNPFDPAMLATMLLQAD